MIQVFKCDYCQYFKQDAEEVRLHEKICSFNPINKKCYTCQHSFEDGYPIGGSCTGCKKGLDVCAGEDDGNCHGWELE